MLNRIEIVRGTSNTFQIEVVDANGTAYNLASNEKIIFGVKAKAEDTELVFSKTAEAVADGVYSVKLVPEDTQELSCGKYSYDVGLQKGTDYFNIIEPTAFVITPNVTFRGCVE